MPKVTYTKSKGLFQESGSTFVVQDVPIVQAGRTARPQAPKIVLDIYDGSTSAANATHLNDVVITLHENDGTERNYVLNVAGGVTIGVAEPAVTNQVNVAIGGADAHGTIATKIGRAIAAKPSADTEYYYQTSTAAGEGFNGDGTRLIIYSMKANSGSSRLPVITQNLGTGNTSRSNDAIVLGTDAGGTSLSTNGSSAKLASNAVKAKDISQLKYGSTVYIADSDDKAHGDVKDSSGGAPANPAAIQLSGLSLEDGGVGGQRVYLVNGSTNRTVKVEGTMEEDNGSSATHVILEAGDIQLFVWSGERWQESLAINIGAPVVT